MENTLEILSEPWHLMWPEIVITVIALSVLTLEFIVPKTANRSLFVYMALIGIAAATVLSFNQLGTVGSILDNMYRVDAFAVVFKLLVLGGTALVLVLSLQKTARALNYFGEYVFLLLTSLLGSMVMAASADLITLFVGLELLSISSYVMVGLRKKVIESSEAAFKYVVTGGIATAIFLFGASYLYGLTGTTNLFEMMDQLAHPGVIDSYGKMIYFAFLITFVGLSFKIAAVPFHMWAPDVYQGAPTLVTAFLSVVSKTAGFAIVLRFLVGTFAWEPGAAAVENHFLYENSSHIIAIIAAGSMIIGNVMALLQINVKRLMAYSSIAQAGYLLVPLATANPLMIDQIIFYLLAYLFMNIGAFAIIDLVTNEQGTEELRAFSGLYHRSPFVAVAMTIFLISLAGIPLTIGFFGKLYIFFGAIWSDYIWLAVVMAITSVISYYYYFGIARQMYMRSGETSTGLRKSWPVTVVVVIGLVGTLVGGVLPGQILDVIQQQFQTDKMFQMFEKPS